jgi:hypothetical protein
MTIILVTECHLGFLDIQQTIIGGACYVRFIPTPAEDAGRLASAAVVKARHRHNGGRKK